MRKNIIFILVPVFVVLIAFAIWVYINFRGPGVGTERERFVVRLDSSEEQVVDDLLSGGFLKNKTVFNFILSIKGWHKKIEPGGYMVDKKMNAYQLAGTLVYGPYQKWVVIPPGKRKEQVALIIQRTLNWPFSLTRSFINVAEEGYLYPDTYLINIDSDPQEIVQKLKNNFNEKFNSRLQEDLLRQNIRNDTALKIASLIERESGGAEDKPIISGIIWNRLNKGMRLEIDATVQYAIVSGQLDDSGLQSLENFNFWPTLGAGIVRTINSPYNTYQIKALPPGPICSPGIDSLRAVAYPAETEAFYYLHSPDRQIHTAKTFKEHQENIIKYLQ